MAKKKVTRKKVKKKVVKKPAASAPTKKGKKKVVKKKVKPDNRFRCVTGDCIRKMRTLVPNSVDLAIADPPYNIGYDAYDQYNDKRPRASYLEWAFKWMGEIHRVLRRSGSFWLAMCDEYAAQMVMLATRDPLLQSSWHGDFKFHLRSWVVWYYTFGVAAQKNFSRSHTHWLYFTKQKTNFYFDKQAVRVPSNRQLVYNDKRALKGGKQPDNTWVLTREALLECFGPDVDTWLESRVCGTYHEREHRGTYQESKGVPQMPEAIIERIIAPCCPKNGVVIDPFLGTGTTGVVAVRLGHEFWGCDISGDYVAKSKRRIAAA